MSRLDVTKLSTPSRPLGRTGRNESTGTVIVGELRRGILRYRGYLCQTFVVQIWWGQNVDSYESKRVSVGRLGSVSVLFLNHQNISCIINTHV